MLNEELQNIKILLYMKQWESGIKKNIGTD